jgi:hypothetical protein
MNKLFLPFFAIFMAQVVVACPTKIINDSGFVIGIADRDLSVDSLPEKEFVQKEGFVEIIQPGQKATKDVTPKEHNFFIYIQQGNVFIKKLEVIFKFCGSVLNGSDTEVMTYSDIEQEKIKSDNTKWKEGKFDVGHYPKHKSS